MARVQRVRVLSDWNLLDGSCLNTHSLLGCTDPSDAQVQQLLAEGIQCMANADLEGAQSAYQRSLEIKETPGGR